MLTEIAAGTRKRPPSEHFGLSKFDPEEFTLTEYNPDLRCLREIVAQENTILAEY